MNASTSLKAGPIDVCAKLLEVIGHREDGVSRSELSREMRELAKGQDPFFYEKDLALLVMERQVSLSFCGPDHHRIQVYTLASSYGKTSEDQCKKRCYRCKRFKDINSFRRRNDSKDRRNGQCKTCENKQRKLNGWSNKAKKRRQEELAKEQVHKNPPYLHQAAIPTEDELKETRIKVRAQSLEEHRQKLRGDRYIDVEGRAVSVVEQEISPIVEFKRAWRRIKAG